MYTMTQVLEDIKQNTGMDATPYIPIPPEGCPARNQSTRLYSEVVDSELNYINDLTERMETFFKHYTLPEVDILPDLGAYTLYGFRFGDSIFRHLGVFEEESEIDDRLEAMQEEYPFAFVMVAYKVVAMLKRATH